MTTPAVDAGFARKVREKLAERGMTLAELAEATGFEASLLSRITAEADGTRRAPQVEHILGIARALGVAAPDLVSGTAASDTLGEWVPRSELLKESSAREKAQKEASEFRSTVANLGAQLDAAKRSCVQLEARAGTAESKARGLAIQNFGLTAQIGNLQAERDMAFGQAAEYWEACCQARAQAATLGQHAQTADKSANVAWAVTGFAAIGSILGAVASSGKKPARAGRRRS